VARADHDPVGSFVLTTLHVDKAVRHWFIDLANLDIDNATDTIHSKGSFTIQWRLPASFSPHSFTGHAVLCDPTGPGRSSARRSAGT